LAGLGAAFLAEIERNYPEGQGQARR